MIENSEYLPENIPGMIEPIEQMMLKDLASRIIFDKNEIAVEFGTFFGRSTACIASGLILNKSFKENCKFYAYDSFECKVDGGFYPYLDSFAKKGNVFNLLEINNGTVNFIKIFEHYNQKNITSGFLIPVKAELSNSFPKSETIKFIHIDSPKFYSDFKYILFRFFPKLQLGGYVVFQDFFYHWSASLIAVCGLLIKEGFLKVEKTAASSLCCTIEKNFNTNELNEIDLAMDTPEKVLYLIEYSINYIDRIEIDRKSIFLPRLTLAKIQFLYENNMQKKAAQEIVQFFKNGNTFNINIINDFLDLFKHGFSIRKLYEQDHNIK